MTIKQLPLKRPTGKTTVLTTWDGKADPLSHLHIDSQPDFDLILFDYSGTSSTHQNKSFQRESYRLTIQQISATTECKGEIFQILAQHLTANDKEPEYICLLDDDVIISVSDINRAIHIAKTKNLDVFSPALTHDSEFTHRWMLQQPHVLTRNVPWVEVMMPFYRGDLFLTAAPFFNGYVSSWGFDKYLFPMLQEVTGAKNCCIVDAVAASHFRPITSQTKTYKNGMNALQEMQAVKEMCIRYVNANHPDLISTSWYNRIFVQKNVYSRTQKHTYQVGRLIKKWLARSA
jgi:hypothetical protein